MIYSKLYTITNKGKNTIYEGTSNKIDIPMTNIKTDFMINNKSLHDITLYVLQNYNQ